jgi:hypothetical protein
MALRWCHHLLTSFISQCPYGSSHSPGKGHDPGIVRMSFYRLPPANRNAAFRAQGDLITHFRFGPIIPAP